jgi:hypothetical protein
MGEGQARQGFRVRLEAVERALARLADDPLRHRALIQDLETLRQRCLAALDRRGRGASNRKGVH